MAWHHHNPGDPMPNDIVERTPFGHRDQIDHLSDILGTMDAHNLAEWDESKQRHADHMEINTFYIDADDKENTIPPLMKRFIRTFKDKQ